MVAWFITLKACFAATPADDAARWEQVREMYAGYRSAWAGREAPEIDAETLARRLNAGEALVLVDVRSPEERAVSTLPGAIPKETVEAHPEQFRGKALVAYCTIGYRSGLWTAEERAQGLDVTNLAAGVLAWTYTGRPLVGPEGETKRVHVYGKTWDLARTDYTPVW